MTQNGPMPLLRFFVAVAVGLAGPMVAAAGGHQASAQVGVDCGIGARAGCVAWSDRPALSSERGNRNWGRAVATGGDGSAVFVTANGFDLAYGAATGNLRWKEANSTGGAGGAQDIAMSPSGSMVVSVGGTSVPDADRVLSGQVVVTARDPKTGTRRWQSRFGDTERENLIGHAVAVTETRVFVAGRRLPGGLVMLAFDAGTGALLWSANWDGPAEGSTSPLAKPVDVVATPDGHGVFLTAIARPAGRPWVQWVTLAYDGGTGRPRWEARHTAADDSSAEAREMAVHPDGDLLYVTGWGHRPSPSGASFDFLTIAYDTATGRPAWTGGYGSLRAGFPVDSNDLGWSVDISPDGRRVYVAGYSDDPVPGYRIEARDARTGAEQWSTLAPLATPTQDQEGLFGLVKVRSSAGGGEVYVAMSAYDEAALAGRDVSFAVAGFDSATGDLLWRGSYHDTERIQASYLKDLAVDPRGARVYVTGQAWNHGAGFVQVTAFLAGRR
ncbi:MAG: PQQ-binding-like beta-propeller repeat protein [Acidimicrobiia bacterium]